MRTMTLLVENFLSSQYLVMGTDETIQQVEKYNCFE